MGHHYEEDQTDRKIPPPPPKRLSIDQIPDEDLIAELQKRGLVDRRGIVTILLKQRDKAIKERDEALHKLRKVNGK